MAVSDITNTTAGSSLGATQVTGVQRVEQRQLRAAAEAERQETQQADAAEQPAVTEQAADGGAERTAENTPRGSLLDITV